MAMASTRRRFLQLSAAGMGLTGLGDLGFLTRLPRVSAQDQQLDSRIVQFQPEIEPLVRLLEETRREALLDRVAEALHAGVTYRELLAALLLAGVRNVQPRPQPGFKFHAVLVVNAAHLASLSSPAEHRWLPIFWALDYFKSAQARDVQEGDWTMAPVNESAVPPAPRVRAAFIAAMDEWNEAATDVAVAGLARTHGANEIYELFFRYGIRDFRAIGHKAIFVANSLRTLNCIGWRYSEPVLRSLAYALLAHDGPNPSQADAEPDRPWRQNLERAAKIHDAWPDGQLDDAATLEMLSTLRGGAVDDCCELVVHQLNRGVAPQSVWDGLLLGAAELLVRQPGIVSLHALTSTNAMHYAFQVASNDETRKMLLLQNAAFVPLFLGAMRGRGNVGEFAIDRLEADTPAKEPKISPSGLIEEICTDISHDRMQAARKLLRYVRSGADAKSFVDAARVLVFLKGDDAHDYKFSSAVLEDFYQVSPQWRDRYLAASVFKLRGSGEPDNRLVQQTRAALARA